MDQEEPETWRSAGGGSFGSTVAPVAAPGELKSEEDERMFAVNRSLQWQYAAAAAAAALRPPVAVCRAQSPAARAIKKRKKRREGAFWAGIESTLPSAGAAMGINSLDEVAVVDRRVRGEEDLGRGGSATRAIKKREDGLFWAGMESTSWSAAVPAPGVDSLDEIAVVDGKLRDVLRGLGASAPVRIYGKRLSKSDRVTNQHRLLMSCRSWRHGEPFPFDEVLTAEERPSVQVQAYDRAGRPYVLDCKKLECNKAYRLIAGWRRFLTSNGLAVADDARAEDLEPAMVELWAFRSPALTVGVAGQPRGKLGLVIVHYRQGDAPHADAAIAEVLAAARNRAAMALPAAVPALEHAVGAAREDSMEEADDGRWPDARALEAAEALLMLSES